MGDFVAHGREMRVESKSIRPESEGEANRHLPSSAFKVFLFFCVLFKKFSGPIMRKHILRKLHNQRIVLFFYLFPSRLLLGLHPLGASSGVESPSSTAVSSPFYDRSGYLGVTVCHFSALAGRVWVCCRWSF